MFPLERGSDGRWSWVGDRDRFGVEGTDLSTLSMPFNPGDLRGEQQRLWAEQPDQDDAAHRDWLTRWDEVLWVPGRTDGAIYLCHQGCGHRYWLVVSGPQQNTIWSDARGSDEDLAPELNRTGQPMTFSTWYLEWLEHAEATVAVRG